MAQPNAYIGSPLDRLEDPKLLTGTATFVADLNPAGLLFAAILRSPVAHAVIESVLKDVAQMVRPGLRCRELFAHVKAKLDAYLPGAFFHHLGHGIGLYPHEAPHLNSAWDDVFEEGDVFTAEPGLYHENLRAGIRIEEDYLVTATGVEKLTSFPTAL